MQEFGTISGRVVRGKQLGRTLGFPTANIECDPSGIADAGGVYAGWTAVDGVFYPVVLNIGLHPTFPEGAFSVEAHLIGYEGDLYGRELKVSFLACIRGEKCFDSIDALRHQIARDIDTAIEVFNDYVKNGGGSEND